VIDVQDRLISEGEVVCLSNGVMLMVPKVNGSRPSAVTIKSDIAELEIVDFAQGRFSANVNCLVPVVEVVIWEGKAFIVGLPSIVIAGSGNLLKVDLFRKREEDTGFYMTEWMEFGQRLICVYESGIVAWSEDGHELWHIRKYWDDIFTGVEAGQLVLLREDGQRIIIDPSGGARDLRP
jgi:hypothetical protein